MEILTYLAKANLYLILFYCNYQLFLSRHTFFHWNRFYLLGAVAASFLLPAIVFYSESAMPFTSSEAIELVKAPEEMIRVTEETNNWPLILLGCYAAGVLFMLFNLLRSIRRIFVLIRNGEHIQLEDYTLILLNTVQPDSRHYGSFSFFKWMIVDRQDYESNPDTIFRHEHVHIRQLHSIDILLIECLKVVFWINPVIWFYKRSIQAVHEYLADTEATDRESYSEFLIAYALKVPEQMLGNHFSNSSLLKDRIKMIYKNRTSSWLLSKYLLILPLAAITVILTAARKDIPQPVAAETKAQVNGISIQGTVSDQNGKRIPGAIVIIKNTTQGAATDQNGKFELRNIPENSAIVVSHIQFKSREIAVSNDKASYDVVIEPDEAVMQGPTITRNPAIPKPAPAKIAKPDTSQDKNAFKVAEQKPEFPGGYGAMVEYLRNSIKYPAAALKANVEGVVIVRFIVDKEGALNSIVIVKGVGFGLDAESVRLVKDMPKWKPGIQNGQTVDMAQTIEIKFDLATAKGDKRQGFHLPKFHYALNFNIAKVKVEDLFSSSLAFFEPKTFNPYQNPPKAESRYIPDSSSYRFMNYNNGWTNYNTVVFRPDGPVLYKFHKNNSK